MQCKQQTATVVRLNLFVPSCVPQHAHAYDMACASLNDACEHKLV
jgi:hypothetical protein